MRDERLQKTPITAEDWSLGSPDALVTMLEYGDFESASCATSRPVLEGLVLNAPDMVRLVYRHFPIPRIHPNALAAAEVAEAAGARGKFWEMHDMLYEHCHQLEIGHLLVYAEAIGFPADGFDAEMSSHAYLDEIRRDVAQGLQDDVKATPTLFINRWRYDGPRDRSPLLAVIATAAAEAQRARRRRPEIR